MNILGKAGMWFNKKKCQILPSKLQILGYILTEKGLQADPTKIKQIQDYSVPKTRKELQRFMGIVNYLRGYCLQLASKSTGLAELQEATKQFKWTHMHQEVFEQCKKLIMSNKILQSINHELGKPIYLITDASQTGIAGWLGQEDKDKKIRPTEFHSRKLKNSQIHYRTYQKELFAIYNSLQYFQNTLAGHTFTILTDHRLLEDFISQTQKNAVKDRWQIWMASSLFNFTIKHIEGKKNVIADAVSRCEPENYNTTQKSPLENSNHNLPTNPSTPIITNSNFLQPPTIPLSHKMPARFSHIAGPSTALHHQTVNYDYWNGEPETQQGETEFNWEHYI